MVLDANIHYSGGRKYVSPWIFGFRILPIFSGTPWTTDILYTSLESPNTQLLKSEIRLGVASF